MDCAPSARSHRGRPLATPRYELVDGELLVTPSPALPHQVVVTRLLVALVAYLDPEGIGVAIPSPTSSSSRSS